MESDAAQLFEDFTREFDRVALSRPKPALERTVAALGAALGSGTADEALWRTFYREARLLVETLQDAGATLPTLHAFLRENQDLGALHGVREPSLP